MSSQMHDEGFSSEAYYKGEPINGRSQYEFQGRGQKLLFDKMLTVNQKLALSLISTLLFMLFSLALFWLLLTSESAYSYGPVQLFLFLALILSFIVVIVVNINFYRRK
ncbi:hypothetical protein [Tengunoibacter tsumagoiensis]|uniref:Uncharacterized protein n=1 Tax=Tengunoibacter tsumagoiensis TaxID=2014871 RepID=A0A402A1Q8_9CHLR|nr:hypothetical protein [Tengunoibacter tsumagoiensis]GCE13087.1 hypothetical protein KTT_29460 [Tengunoibacter tsumagoiensis]